MCCLVQVTFRSPLFVGFSVTQVVVFKGVSKFLCLFSSHVILGMVTDFTFQWKWCLGEDQVCWLWLATTMLEDLFLEEQVHSLPPPPCCNATSSLVIKVLVNPLSLPLPHHISYCPLDSISLACPFWTLLSPSMDVSPHHESLWLLWTRVHCGCPRIHFHL